jgi:type IV secretion system protein VirB5
MTKFIRVFIGVCMLWAPAPYAKASGIPTVDVAAIAQDAANFIQTMAHYAAQIDHYVKDFEQQVKYYKAMTDPRMVGLIESLYTKGKIDIDPEKIMREFGITLPDGFEFDLSPAALRDYERRLRTASEYLSRAQNYQKEAESRMGQLQKLVDKTQTIKDPKDAFDLSATIQAQQAMLQNETIRQLLAMQEVEATKLLHEQLAHEKHLRTAEDRGVPFPARKN